MSDIQDRPDWLVTEIQQRQLLTSSKPLYRNATNATLEIDGIVIEASNDVRIVVRGDLLEKLATLVTMARMAKLIGAYEP